MYQPTMFAMDVKRLLSCDYPSIGAAQTQTNTVNSVQLLAGRAEIAELLAAISRRVHFEEATNAITIPVPQTNNVSISSHMDTIREDFSLLKVQSHVTSQSKSAGYETTDQFSHRASKLWNRKYRSGRKYNNPDRVDPKDLRTRQPSKIILDALKEATKAEQEAIDELMDTDTDGSDSDADEEDENGNKIKKNKKRKTKKYKSKNNKFEGMRDAFLSKFSACINAEIPGAKLVPANVGQCVKDRALEINRSNMDFGYHGTHSTLHKPIFDKGLLVPGASGVGVRNGSVYGVGIYSANPGNHSQSLGFSDNSTLLVCAINTANTSGVGGVTNQGSFRVIFDSNLIAPLFTITVPPRTPYCYTPTTTAPPTTTTPTSTKKNKIALPPLPKVDNKGNTPWVGTHRNYFQTSGEVVWVPPEEQDWKHAKKVKRRIVDKKQKNARRNRRDLKATNQGSVLNLLF